MPPLSPDAVGFVLHLLGLSVQGLAFAPRLPQFGIALVALLAAALHARSRRAGAASHPLRELGLLYAAPLALLVWADALAGSLQGVESPWEWQALGIYALLFAQLVAAVALLVRHRARLGAAATLALGAVWWAAGASLVAVMSVYDDWL